MLKCCLWWPNAHICWRGVRKMFGEIMIWAIFKGCSFLRTPFCKECMFIFQLEGNDRVMFQLKVYRGRQTSLTHFSLGIDLKWKDGGFCVREENLWVSKCLFLLCPSLEWSFESQTDGRRDEVTKQIISQHWHHYFLLYQKTGTESNRGGVASNRLILWKQFPQI